MGTTGNEIDKAASINPTLVRRLLTSQVRVVRNLVTDEAMRGCRAIVDGAIADPCAILTKARSVGCAASTIHASRSDEVPPALERRGYAEGYTASIWMTHGRRGSLGRMSHRGSLPAYADGIIRTEIKRAIPFMKGWASTASCGRRPCVGAVSPIADPERPASAS